MDLQDEVVNEDVRELSGDQQSSPSGATRGGRQQGIPRGRGGNYRPAKRTLPNQGEEEDEEGGGRRPKRRATRGAAATPPVPAEVDPFLPPPTAVNRRNTSLRHRLKHAVLEPQNIGMRAHKSQSLLSYYVFSTCPTLPSRG